MNTKYKLLGFSLIISLGIVAENVPCELKEQLYGLTNYWGNGTSIREYQIARQNIMDSLVSYDDRTRVLSDWTECFLRHITDNVVTDESWMSESGGVILSSSYAGATRCSTNCWYVTAEYVDKLEKLRKKAELGIDQICASNRFDMSTESAMQRIEEWNRLAALEKALNSSMYATTNVFPRWILPTLLPEEAAALYTNVLRRAGLVQ